MVVIVINTTLYLLLCVNFFSVYHSPSVYSNMTEWNNPSSRMINQGTLQNVADDNNDTSFAED